MKNNTYFVENEDGKNVEVLITFIGTGCQTGFVSGREVNTDNTLGEEWGGESHELGKCVRKGKVKTMRVFIPNN